MQAIVVDDEGLAVARLCGLLARFDDVSVVGKAANGGEALELMAAHRPDALFLDIEMPVLDGFDVVEEIARRGDLAPLIVFVTAFPNFAAAAFETGAIDFLTKPVRFNRLEVAVQRLRRALDTRSSEERLQHLVGQLEALRRERVPGWDEQRFLWVQSRGETMRVDLERVDRIAAEGEYVRLFLGEVSHLHRGSVTDMAGRLNEERFVRIHRSHIVRKEKVVSVKRRATGGYQLTMEGGIVVPVGRSYRGALATIVAKRPHR
ncbi:MAG: DNA-binding response regulator [Alphaproteobacteria bacterium]|nr:DNA-binding response regulator [Alphaproteobacteria bacterium]